MTVARRSTSARAGGFHVWQVQNIGRRADHLTDHLPSDTLHVE